MISETPAASLRNALMVLGEMDYLVAEQSTAYCEASKALSKRIWAVIRELEKDLMTEQEKRDFRAYREGRFLDESV